MRVVALAGGIGAGKFLRGLARVIPGDDLTVIVNVGDDVVVHGLHVSPDPDSVLYWLGGVFDRERGWGRRDETFRATEALRSLDAERAWFGLGDLDLGTHLFRTGLLREGASLTAVTARLAEALGVTARILPVSDDPIETRIECHDAATGELIDLHFQEYWVRRRAADPVVAVRYRGAAAAGPGPSVLEAIATADAVVFCPSNPVVSIGPILAVPGVRDAVVRRRATAVGVSGIVGGAPVAGMADKLMPAVGIDVSALGVAHHYRPLLSAWLVDDADAASVRAVEELGLRCRATDTIMVDDDRAEKVARAALELLA
jgi:LPPG:FO 2-phospho-L-lactate transferase